MRAGFDLPGIRTRGALTVVVAAALVAGLVCPVPAAVAAQQVGVTGGTAADFGPDAATSADVLVDGWGDGDGYHVQVATERSGFTWQEAALLRPADLDDESWVGYQCVSGDGRFAAVAVLPRSVVNNAAARDHGAFAYSVDLTSGTVRPLASGVGLKYHTPGCGTGAMAVFSLNPGVDQQRTELLSADLASGAVTRSGAISGQLTSVVPTPRGNVGVTGSSVVLVAGDGSIHPLSTVDGSAYDLRPSADGGVDYLTVHSGARDAEAFHVVTGPAHRIGSGDASALHLFLGRAGHTVVTGARETARDSGLVAADPAGLTTAMATSLDGHAVLGSGGDADHPQPAVAATHAHKVFPRPWARSTAEAVTAVAPRTSTMSVATAQTPTCSVPRLDPSRQVPQPSPPQVAWAVQLAEQNLLTGSAYTRPAGFDNLGLVAYAPNNDFPKIALHHPAGDSWDSVPRSVMQAILAQESNWSQASWHSIPGMTGDPLIADYYGAGGDIVSINYAGADCGYGIAQVTTGMRAGEHVHSVNGQKKIAVDYQENIAAGLQILESTWNQLFDAGITANGGNPRYLENWYLAAWAYNTGIQPNAANGNTTGCTPGPTCTGPHGTWGLGWTNNPANLDYPPTRAPFLQLTYDDARHPASWPYQERVLGWMGSPIIRFGSRAYATPTYHGGNTWPQIPAFATFCAPDNHCDPNATNPSNPGASHCLLDDFQCWWHLPVSWVSTCATTCTTSDYTATGGAEPGVANPHPPTCSLDTSKVPTSSNGAPIIVDEQPSPPLNLVGCGSSNWSNNGTFGFSYGTNANGDPIGAIDTHQLGSGFGGRILFTHTEDGANPNLINTGTWTPNLPSLQYYKIKIHIPALGASATNVVYQINPGGGVSPWKIRVNQHWDSEEWVTIGTFAMQNGGNVQLSNLSTSVSNGHNLFNFDVAYDALAFLPMGGTPGSPIGGPPGIIDAPKGSNPAFVQCGCVRRTAGDPVDTSTGYFGDTFTDLSTPGRGAPLNFTRTYASALANPSGPNGTLAVNGPFGWGWTFSYNLTATTDGPTGNVTIRQEDGSAVTFLNSSGSYAPAAPRFDAALTVSGPVYTYTRRGRQVFTFDLATGRLTAATDLAGTKASPAYATALAYDGAGHLSTITDPANHRYTLTWTGGHITGLADTAGRQVSYGYDGAGNLTDVYGVGSTRAPTLRDDDHMVFGYAAGTHLITLMRTPRQFGSTATPTPVTAMTWDTADRVRTQTDPAGGVTTFTYGPDGGLATGQTQVTDPVGHKTLYTYTGGLLTSETRGAGSADAGTWTYTYDPVTLGITSMADPNGNLRTFTYDDHGNRTSASDGNGFTTIYQYDDAGDLVTVIDPRGVRTTTTYDESGHLPAGATGERVLTSTTVAQLDQSAEIKDGNPGTLPTRTVNYFYDDTAHPADRTRTVDPKGNTTSTAYDTFGNQTASTDPEGDRTLVGYDTGKGWITSLVSPVGAAAGITPGCTPPARGCTTYGHDAWGHTTSTTDPLGHTSSAVFDADGNQTVATDANNRTTTLGYDAANRPATMTRADNTTTSTEYNPDGTVAATVDGLTRRTTFGYDGQGRRTSRTDPDTRVTSGHSDGAGNLVTTTDATGRVTTYAFDPANRLSGISYSDGTTPNVTLGYDSAGARVSMTDGTGTTAWDIDAFGEVTGVTRGSGAHLGYTYDDNGNASTISYPGGSTVTQTFDRANRLRTVTDWNNKTTTFGYGSDGELRVTAYPNGTTITNGYDDSTTLTSSALTASSTTLASLGFGRDNTHRLNASNPVGLTGANTTFGYSPREQLSSATSGSTVTNYPLDAAGNPTGLGAATQAFDPAGRLCWTLPSGTVTNPACASTPAGATTYTFSDRGERVRRTPATGTATVYGYDQAERLTSVSGPVSATYRYDGDGLRTAKTVAGATTAMTWGAGAPAPLISDGTTSFVYGPGGQPIEQVTPGATLWFFHDQLGSTRALVDGSAAIVGRYGYGEYGVPTHTGTAATPLQYAGQYTDSETGLVYLRARFYDPATAQFLTVDPMVNDTRTPYTYVGGDPLNELDPSGLCGFWCKVGIGAAIVGTAACIIAEPCGAIEGAAIVTTGGAIAFTSVTVSVAPVVIGGTIAGGVIGGLFAASTSGDSGGGSTAPRDVHGQVRAGERQVDVEHVCEEGDLYYQDDGQIVRVLHNGDGTIDVVVRDPANPSGETTTEIPGAPESYLQRKLASGQWFE